MRPSKIDKVFNWAVPLLAFLGFLFLVIIFDLSEFQTDLLVGLLAFFICSFWLYQDHKKTHDRTFIFQTMAKFVILPFLMMTLALVFIPDLKPIFLLPIAAPLGGFLYVYMSKNSSTSKGTE